MGGWSLGKYLAIFANPNDEHYWSQDTITQTILSIQSEVVRGHVGNGAARFALQRLGFDVWALPTVLLSNHPGHGKFRGEEITAARLGELIHGLAEHGWLKRCAGVISGYLGAAEQARVVVDAVRQVKSANPSALFLCDPVFGDEGGAYAGLGVAEAMARDLLPLADIATPNRFELSSLTSQRIDSPADAVRAARMLGVREVLATSVPCGQGRIGSIVVTARDAWMASADRLANVPSGTGDLLSAIYLGARVSGAAPPNALQRAASSVHAIIEASSGADELALIAHQHDLVAPVRRLSVEAVV